MLQKYNKREIWLIAVIMLIGGLIRFVFHYNRDFQGDEVGTLQCLSNTIPDLLSSFEAWCTMNYFILLEKLVFNVFHGSLKSLMLIPMIAGITSLPLSYILAKRFLDYNSAVLVTILMALNPYLILYSGIIRSYSLLLMLSLIVFICFFIWLDKKTFRNGILLSISIYFMILVHPNGLFILISIAIFLLFKLLLIREKYILVKSYLTFIVPLMFSGLFLFFSYLNIIPEMIVEGEKVHTNPPNGITFGSEIIKHYFAAGFFGWVSLFLIVFGTYMIIANKHKLLRILPFIFIPFLLISAQGVDHYPWTYARFLIFILPFLIFTISYSIIYISSLHNSKWKKPINYFIVVVLLATWGNNLYAFHDKYKTHKWSELSKKINKTKGKSLFISGDKSYFHLTPYIDKEILTIDKITGKQLNSEQSLDVYIIFSQGPSLLNTMNYDQYDKIVVVKYPNMKLRHAIIMFKNDLIELTNELSIDKDLTKFYKNLYYISILEDNRKDELLYSILLQKSSKLSRRDLNMPKKIKKVHLNREMKSLKRILDKN